MNLRQVRWSTIPSVATVALLVVGSLLLSSSPVSGQSTGILTGTVIDQGSGRPISAAQIQVLGTILLAVTDANGVYRLANVPAGVVELRVQRLGYALATRSITIPPAGGTVTADFSLTLSAVALDALVVTATGSQRRRELGNATATIQVAEELERSSPATLTSLLQGLAPGVQIMQGAGSIGTAASITMRGNGSINLGNFPLIYIDGARVSNDNYSGPDVGGQTTSRLNDLDLDDIATIEMVRGPSAATLYGTEAAAGVIRITTKRGRSGRSEWTVRTEFGGNWDATEWAETVFNPRAFFGPAAADTLYRLNLLEQVGTDQNPWRTGIERSMGLSLSGGSEGVTYYISGNWDNRNGSLASNRQTQRNVRANLDLAPSERMRIGVSFGFGSSQLSLPRNDNDVFGYIGVAQIGFPWELPIQRTDPVTGQPNVDTCPLSYEASRTFGIPLGAQPCSDNPFFSGRTFEDVATLSNTQKIERFTGSVTFDYRPLPFLSAVGTIGYDQFSDQSGVFVPVDPERPFGDSSLGFRAVDAVVNRNLTIESNLISTFALTPNIRSVTSLGAQFTRGKQELVETIGRYLPVGGETVGYAVKTEGFENLAESRVLGLFLEQRFGYRERLFLIPAVRFDESSGFDESLGGKAYPRLMASYVISEEAWFDRLVGDSFVTALRLRGAWGTSGKEPSAFASVPVLGGRRVTFQDQDVAGVVVTRPANPDLKPETGEEVEAGFEADLFGGRVGVDFTWYRKVTHDAVVARQMAPSTGYAGDLFTNVGEIVNSGIEVGLTGVAWNTPRVRWDWRLNLASTEGEITQLDEPIVFGLAGNSQRHQEGYPYAGYWSVTYEVDENGAVIPSDSAVYVGQPTPKVDGSLSSSLTLFGNLTLYANLGFAGGFQRFNGTEQFQCGFLGGGEYGGICPQIFETDAEGERTDRARIKARAAQDQQFSPWIEDADFFRLRVISAQILLPEWLTSRVGASRGSFSLSAENLFLFTDYSGLDPEVNAAGGDEWIRAEFLTLPPARRVTGRLSITF